MLFESYFQPYWHAQIKYTSERTSAKHASALGIVIFLKFDSIFCFS